MKSPLKWVGGKRWQLEPLRELLARHELIFELQRGDARWVEPFCGSCSLAIGFAPLRALLNDTNEALINFWLNVKHAASFDLELTPTAETYLAVRQAFNDAPKRGVLQASRFYALNRWAYGGMYRTNQRGNFNVPPRPVLRPLTSPYDAVDPRLMIKWTFSDLDFAFLDLEPTDVVYADPPYDDGFTGYGARLFDWERQVELARLLAYHPGPVILMNKATARVLKLYDELGYEVSLIEGTQRLQHAQRGAANLEVTATKNLVDTSRMIGS